MSAKQTQKPDQTQASNNPLGYGPITGLIARFAIPTVTSMLVMAAYNITDQIFIGHVVGMLGNAATNVAFPVTTFTTAFAQMAGVGTAANFNLNMGAKREEEAGRYVGTGLTMMALLGAIIFFIITLLKTPILLLCGATDNVLPYAQLYLGVTAFGLPFHLITNAGSALVRADGSPKWSMVCNVSGAVLNVFLDWLFMFVFDWGIQGAAAATVIGQMVSCALCISYFPRFKAFRITRTMLRLRPAYMSSIARLGTSNFINHTIMMLVNIVLNNQLTFYGALSIYGEDIPLAVAGIAAKLNSILMAFSVGLAQGCQPIWSFNMGARNYSRVKEAYKRAFSMALGISVVFFLLFQFFPRQITSIFGNGEELYFQFAARYLKIYMFMVALYCVQPLSVNYFTATGNVRQGIVISLSRQGFLLLPLLYFLPKIYGLDGVLYAGPIADFLAAVLSLSMVFWNFRKLSSLSQQAADDLPVRGNGGGN